eukprot:GFUD01037552.1.p1 GENE.GFUD01037552.1~~GFUD01037552.1.p1  ORF type:complete len:180 (+),score=61.60 GFUD01037552.1:39-578(+)
MSRPATRLTDTKKVSGELFSLTYGALVAQIVKDYQSVEDVNKQLEKMGYNVGVRIIEDFLARTKEGKCADFRETAEKVQAAFKLYLNMSPTVTSWSAASDQFSLVFEANPIAEFVELPDNYADLQYSNILCGAIRGALEMVHIEVAAWFAQDNLKGDSVTELRVKFIRKVEDTVPAGDD